MQTRQAARVNVLERYRSEEAEQLARLPKIAELDATTTRQIEGDASDLVATACRHATQVRGIDALMQRIRSARCQGHRADVSGRSSSAHPDSQTIDKLIADHIVGSTWESHNADLRESHMGELIALHKRQAGKTSPRRPKRSISATTMPCRS